MPPRPQDIAEWMELFPERFGRPPDPDDVEERRARFALRFDELNGPRVPCSFSLDETMMLAIKVLALRAKMAPGRWLERFMLEYLPEGQFEQVVMHIPSAATPSAAEERTIQSLERFLARRRQQVALALRAASEAPEKATGGGHGSPPDPFEPDPNEFDDLEVPWSDELDGSNEVADPAPPYPANEDDDPLA